MLHLSILHSWLGVVVCLLVTILTLTKCTRSHHTPNCSTDAAICQFRALPCGTPKCHVKYTADKKVLKRVHLVLCTEPPQVSVWTSSAQRLHVLLLRTCCKLCLHLKSCIPTSR